MNNTPFQAKPARGISVLFAIFIFAIYCLFATRSYYWDGVLFSWYIENVSQGAMPQAILFHPNHLLYTAVGHLLYQAAQALHIQVRAITLLQIMNSLVSTGCGYLIFCLVREFRRNTIVAYTSWVLFSFGALWWKFSTDADAYIFSTTLLTVSLFLLFRAPPRVVLAGAAHVLAMLFHELALFFYLPALLTIYLKTSKRLTACFWYLLLTSVSVGFIYKLCYLHADHQAFPTLLSWISSHANDANFTGSFAQMAGTNLLTYVKLLAGGKISAISNFFSVTMVLGLVTCAAAIALAVVLWPRETGLADTSDTKRHWRLILWVWLGVYAAFLTFWEPFNAFYKLFLWPPAVLLLSRWFVRPQAILALVIALSCWNFSVFVYPHTHVRANPVLAFAQQVDKELPRSSTIYFKTFNTDDWFLAYFAPGRHWQPLSAETRSRAGCYETSALDDRKDMATHRKRLQNWQLINGQYHIILTCFE